MRRRAVGLVLIALGAFALTAALVTRLVLVDSLVRLPLDQTTDVPPYGTIPVAVARACELTYYCEFRDIHAKTAGYRLIAEMISMTLPRRS